MNLARLTETAGNFLPVNEIKNVAPLGEGFINDTYVIYPKTHGAPKYILQRKNKNIFTDVPAMMENIHKVTTHIKQKIAQKGGNPEREALTILPAMGGALYYKDEEGEFWAACLFIDDHRAYDKVDSPQIAYSGGRGVGRFQTLLADFNETLADILPGFHNIRYRFKQWEQTLGEDRVGRKKDLPREIEWIESRKAEMLAFWELVENGTIPKRVTHNDTKISNILFDPKGEVLCMIDLDTVLQSTVLNDFGDAIRSYGNTAAEDEKDTGKISLDMERYTAFTKGYLEETRHFLTHEELGYLAFSSRYITYEQTLRFLMDYIDGDRYYKIKYPEHNLVRTYAQYTLLQSMEARFEEMEAIVRG